MEYLLNLDVSRIQILRPRVPPKKVLIIEPTKSFNNNQMALNRHVISIQKIEEKKIPNIHILFFVFQVGPY